VGVQGTASIDFGAFPGASDASVDVTGQADIVAGSLVEAWVFPANTTDHTADEHLVETLRVMAGNIVAGTGFTIYGFNTSQLNEPMRTGIDGGGNEHAAGQDLGRGPQGMQVLDDGGEGTRLYGKFNVGWVWN
jgi:hypothetical protein